MSKPQPIPTRPDADQNAGGQQIDAETQRILEERLALDEPSEPWPVVKKRILDQSRRPAP